MIIFGLLVFGGTFVEYLDDLQKEKAKLQLNTLDEETAGDHHHVGAREDLSLIGGEHKQQHSFFKQILLCFAIRQNLHFLANDKHATGMLFFFFFLIFFG